MQREPLRDRARGRWHGILPALGVPSSFLNGKHQPCPICGGKDRARFDDKEGTGTWICSNCGAGDGIALLMKLNGWDFKTAAERIEIVCGDVAVKASRREVADPAKQLEAMRKAWRSAKPIGEVVGRYLRSRGLSGNAVLDIREASNGDMISLVRDEGGNGCQIHRTRLTKDGKKIEGDGDRLFMPGQIPDGAAVRLMRHGETLGIAEGIETALSAAKVFSIPCWAALNTALLKKWKPPVGVRRVVVFGDNDAKFAGHAAAYELARKLAADQRLGLEVDVFIPKEIGWDWNDVLRRGGGMQVIEHGAECRA